MFERGFKTWCENASAQVRRSLGMGATNPLSVDGLASYLGVRLLTPNDIPELSDQALATLLETDKEEWSAVTVSGLRQNVIVYNSSHSPRRRSSDLMHEMAHILLGHEPSQVFFGSQESIALRSYNDQQEQEAVWFSGTLLLPRPALMAIAQNAMDHASACSRYGVSRDLLTYRLNVSGVNAQMRNRRRLIRS